MTNNQLVIKYCRYVKLNICLKCLWRHILHTIKPIIFIVSNFLQVSKIVGLSKQTNKQYFCKFGSLVVINFGNIMGFFIISLWLRDLHNQVVVEVYVNNILSKMCYILLLLKYLSLFLLYKIVGLVVLENVYLLRCFCNVIQMNCVPKFGIQVCKKFVNSCSF